MAYFVYMIECKDGTIYTGIAKDVAKRFEEHARGVGARYTASHPPRRILTTEKFADRSAALRREAQIKKFSRQQKISLTQGKLRG